MQVRVLGEAVDEEADGEEEGTAHGAVQTGLGGGGLVWMGCRDGAVFLDLEEVHGESESGTDAEGDIGETCDSLAPVTLFGEGNGDNGQEQEGDEPGEADPETEEEDDGLGDEHFDGLDGRVVEHLLEVGGFDGFARHVAVIAGGCTEAFGAFAQEDAAAGFVEEEHDHDEEGDVGQALDTLYPAPADGLVDEAGVDGGADGSQDGDVGEEGHGDGAFLGDEHVVEGAAHEDGADAAKETKQGTADDDGGEFLPRARPMNMMLKRR